ncbi:unnamed protein product [Diatraea saccharalis]|uniref:Endonuclease-reverse transcriptase n=1 Tax=Diatraea saccharalis TaxID=40085 RepID=A0A9N9R606_9NEOP|nr:unnamed protein product [Diatraea saccharalis]
MDPQTQIIIEKMNEMRLEFKQRNDELAAKLTENFSWTIEEKLKPIVEENIELKKQVATLQSKVENLEKETRKNNIIIHGVKENETNFADLRSKITSILNELSKKSDMREWDEWEISDLRRLGKRDVSKTRPILITLTLVWRKLEILKNNKNLPTGIYATQDYPKEILIKRNELKVKKRQEELNGNVAYIRYDKLIIKPNNIIKPTDTTKESEKRKRMPTDSPTQDYHEKITAPSKVNKISTLGISTRPRTNSTSGSSKQ